MKTGTQATHPDNQKKFVWKMFDKISRRYDLLNRLLSFRRDVVWRKKIVRHIPNSTVSVLDLATGTGDILKTVAIEVRGLRSFYGLDMAREMLRIGRKKLRQSRLENCLLIPGDATRIPFREGSFDLVTMAFGIRNVPDVDLCLREILRVLSENGRAIILEFSLPANRLFRAVYLFYFRHILPLLGGIISGDFRAYSYLNSSVENFPYGRAFCRLLEQAGFINVTAFPQTFGIATIYCADKGPKK